MGTTFIRIFLLGSLLAFSQDVAAQAPAAPTPDATPVIRVSTRLVLLDVLVQDKKTGNLIGSLGSEDFQVYEDGALQRTSYFGRDQLPLSVVFLFDLTDTVRPVLKPLAEAASEILSHLKPQDEAAIMVFSSHTEVLQDFTTDRALAAAAVEKASEMKSKEGTFIFEDMYEAVQQVRKSTIPGSRRALVWLTDGTSQNENSLTRRTIGPSAPAVLHGKEEATRELVQSGAAVSALIERSALTDLVVATGIANPLFYWTAARLGDVKHYAALTGGPVVHTSKKEAADRLALLIDQLRNRYTLGYYPANAGPEGTFCKLQVKLRPGFYKSHPELKGADIVLRAARGYYR
jgi:VWFA-related protein